MFIEERIHLFYCSFYPLYPPAEDVNVDYECFEVHGRMPVTPHILIVPSDLKQFVKVNRIQLQL